MHMSCLSKGLSGLRRPPTAPRIFLFCRHVHRAALDQATDNLAAHLKAHPDLNLADVAWTLQVGRRPFDCRRAVVAGDVTEAISSLSKRDREHVQTRLKPNSASEVYFLFPGQGSQHPNMAREIYDAEPVFREAVDRCAHILRPHLDADLLTLLYPPAGASDEAKRSVTETVIAQPAIFTIEYALAQLWMSWGIRPKAMVGHSIGEFVAACLAGVISLEDALALVALRGRMMQRLPAGGMLSVRLPEPKSANGCANRCPWRPSTPLLCASLRERSSRLRNSNGNSAIQGLLAAGW
jgi:acyl transferase domain-containing protein